MFKEIKELLSEGVKSKHFPGASYAIVNKDGLLHSDFVGYKQTYPDKILNQGNEIYDCASLTKVISTTTMVMKLIEEDKLTLNSKVISFLPMFKHKDITIYHLLTHTSGLPADIPNARALRNKEEVVSKVFQFELINEIGKHIVYSDIGFILLGFIIEKITCKPLDEYAKEVIFLPLNMSDTSYNPNKELCAPTEYRDDEIFKGLLQGRVHDEKSHALNGISGHAGLFSTPKDIAKFILSILNNDEVVLKKDTVDELFKLRETDTGKSGNLLVRALGWDKPTIGGTAGDNVSFEDTIVHTGFTGCNMWIDRKKGLGFVMLSNAIHPKRVKNGIIKYRNKIGNIITLMEVE
jgi:CubicO group peptidase (beta-lactamase class C family)